MPLQPINPNVLARRNVKRKGSSHQFSRIGGSGSLRASKGKENDPTNQSIVIANDIPKSITTPRTTATTTSTTATTTTTTTTTAPPAEFPGIDLSFLNDETTAATQTYNLLHPSYQYKLTDLHDVSLGSDDFIGGTPLCYASSTFSSTSVWSAPFLPHTSVQKSATTTVRNWKECLLSQPTPAQQCNTTLLNPPTTIRTSNGSLAFPFSDERPRSAPDTTLTATATPVPVSTPASSTPYQPFQVYLDASTASPFGSGESTLDAGFYGCSREECVRIIRGSSRKPTKKSAAKGESVLLWMAHKFHDGCLEVQPDGACFNWCIHAYAELGEPEKAEKILNLMFHSFQNGNEAAEPNVRCFTCLLHAWRKSCASDAPERCDQLIDVMQDLVDRYDMKQCQPDSFTLSVVMQCWVESGRKDAAEHAERAFLRIKDSSYLPDTICVSLLLSAYSKDLAVVKAESLLSDVIDDLMKGASKVEPCTRNFNTLLSMYARMGTHDAPLKAENLVSRFRSLANRGVLAAKPDVYTYSQLLKCWVRSGRQDGVDQAVTCFFWMKDLAEKGETAAMPDSVKYNTIITAFVRDGEVEQAATFLKLQLADVESGKACQPDLGICETVINACASFGRMYLHVGQSLLTLMWQLHDKGHLRVSPRFLTYKKLIWASITLKLPKRAFDLLNEMQAKKVAAQPSYLRKMYQATLSVTKHAPNPQGESLAYHVRTSMNIMFPQHLPTK